MISKTLRIALTIVLASFALSSAARAATCSNASLSGTYAFLHGGTDGAGNPAASSQVKFDPTTGKYTGEVTESANGVVTTCLSPQHTQSPRTAPSRLRSARRRPGSECLLCGYFNRF